MPDLIQGVKDIVDRYDEPPEPTTSETVEGEGGGLEGSLDLEGARGELEEEDVKGNRTSCSDKPFLCPETSRYFHPSTSKQLNRHLLS